MTSNLIIRSLIFALVLVGLAQKGELRNEVVRFLCYNGDSFNCFTIHVYHVHPLIVPLLDFRLFIEQAVILTNGFVRTIIISLLRALLRIRP